MRPNDGVLQRGATMWCSIYQWLVSSAIDSDKRPARLVSRHISRCPDCRRFRQAAVRLDGELRRPAAAPAPATGRPSAPHGGGTLRAEAPRRLPRPALIAGSVVVLAIAVAVIAFLALHRPGEPLRREIARPPHASELDGLVLPISPDAALNESVLAFERLAAASVQAEAGNVAHDAKAVAGVLLTYLPVDVDRLLDQKE